MYHTSAPRKSSLALAWLVEAVEENPQHVFRWLLWCVLWEFKQADLVQGGRIMQREAGRGHSDGGDFVIINLLA